MAHINALPIPINNIIITYSLENPFDDFVQTCVDGNKEIAFWLQNIFKFNKIVPKSEHEKQYEHKICLSKSVHIIRWYETKFGVGEYLFKYLYATVKNKNRNYKRYITQCFGMYILKKDEKYRNSIFEVIIENGTVDMLKYIVEKEKIKMPEDFVVGCSIDNSDILDYVCASIKDPEHKEKLYSDYLDMLDALCVTNDLKSVSNYCGSHLNILNDAIKHQQKQILPRGNFEEHIVTSLITRTNLSKSVYSDVRSRYKSINTEIIIYLLKTIQSPSIEQFKQEKIGIIQYLELTQNEELLNIIENIIGKKLVFL
jgi:hypothetical protein